MPSGSNYLSWQKPVVFLKNATRSFQVVLLINQRVDQPFIQPLGICQASQMMVDGEDVMPQVKAVWQRMEGFCNQLIGITDVICLGIGGSDWGPRLVCDALYQVNPNMGKAIRLHFVANVDSAELATTFGKSSTTQHQSSDHIQNIHNP